MDLKSSMKFVGWTLGAVLLLPAFGHAESSKTEAATQNAESPSTQGSSQTRQWDNAPTQNTTASKTNKSNEGVVTLKSASEVYNRNTSLEGKKVSLTGEVEDIQGSQAFQLDSEGWFNDEILVVTPSGSDVISAASLQEDQQVAVTGTVRNFSKIEFESQTGWDLDPEIEIEFEGTKTVLFADSIERISAE